MSSPANVLVTSGGTANARVGPSPGFSGELEIHFLRPYAIAVGLGPVGFDLADAIAIYDPEDTLLYTGGGASDNEFTFIGFTTDFGDRIGSVVLDASAFAIQDLQFVPEPNAEAQAIAVAAVLWALRRPRSGSQRAELTAPS